MEWAESADFVLPSAAEDCSVLDENGFRIKVSQEAGFRSRMAFTLWGSFSPPAEKRARHRRLAHSERVIMQSKLLGMQNDGGKKSLLSGRSFSALCRVLFWEKTARKCVH